MSTILSFINVLGVRAFVIAASSLIVANIHAQYERPPVIEETEKTLERLENDPTRKRLPEIESIGISHDGISFDELWGLALQYNPSIKQKANQIAAAQGAHHQAGLYANPTLFYAGDNLGVDSKIGKQGMGVTQEIITANKKGWDKAVASYDLATARREYEMERRKLHNDLRIAFANMLHAQLTVQIERYSERLSDELLQGAIERKIEGKSKSIGILQFQTSRKESALKLRQAENDQVLAWRQLVSLIGYTDMPHQSIRGSLIMDSQNREWDSAWSSMRDGSPQMQVAWLKVRQAQANLARQKAERVSNVSATVSLAQDVPAKHTVPFVSVSAPLKIYDRNQGNIMKAQAELAAANREVEKVALALHGDLAAVFRDYHNARETVQAYETSILPGTFEALHQLNELYHDGTIDYIELYTQRYSVLATLQRYNDALKAQSVAATLIDGMLLQGTLKP